jgi:hypothetical protein
MAKKTRILGLVAGTLLVSVAVVNAGQEPALESRLVRRAAVLAACTNFGGDFSPVLGTAGVQVLGFAWNEDDTPVDYPVLRIRDLQKGREAGRTTGTATGRFSFDRLGGGVYLIELIDSKDHIVAVRQPLVVIPGETVGTFIRIDDTVGDLDLFGGSAPGLLEAATNARVRPVGGGFAPSNEG